MRDAQALAVVALHRAVAAQAEVLSAQALVAQAEQQTSAAADAYSQAVNAHPFASDLTGALSAQLAGLQHEYRLASASQWQANQALSAARSSLEAAHALADTARAQATHAAARVEQSLRSASYKAPSSHKGLFGEILGGIADVAVSAGHETTKILSGMGKELGSFGSDVEGFVDYEITHPGKLAELIGDAAGTAAGIALMGVGAGGEILGGGLDVTGLGAVIGVPVNVVSAGVIAAGAATTAVFGTKSIHDLTQTAHQMRDEKSLGGAEGNGEERGAKSGELEGATNYQVTDPADSGRTITDIDHIKDGTLWEEKSATNAPNAQLWIQKQIINKFNAYIEARRFLPGYENAPIGFEFTSPNVDPNFKSQIEQAIASLRVANPNVSISLQWTGS